MFHSFALERFRWGSECHQPSPCVSRIIASRDRAFPRRRNIPHKSTHPTTKFKISPNKLQVQGSRHSSACRYSSKNRSVRMAAALPLTKLASLLVKTLAKPLSKRIKTQFSKNSATKSLLVGIGQTSHAVTSRLQIWSAGYRVKNISPLEPEKALKDGAEFVGESFIFFVSGYLVVWEYRRSNESARKKSEKLQTKLNALDIRLKAVEDVVKQNSQSILGMRGSRYVEPKSQILVPINDNEDTSEESTQQPPKGKDEVVTSPWWKVW